MIEVVVDERGREHLDAWQRAAFIGWQRYVIQPRGEESPPAMDFSEWLGMLGLNSEPEKTDTEVLEEARQFMAMFGVTL